MIDLQKRYEIQDGLPRYGSMAVSVSESGEDIFSEGFVVRFYRIDGTNWVANLERGISDLDGVYALAATHTFLVVAGGTCYIMNPEDTKPISVFGWWYKAVFLTDDGRFVLYDPWGITVVEADGTYWHSERIALDGLKDVVVNGSIVKGLCCKPAGWVPFAYDINTRTFLDGSEGYVF